MLEKKVYELEVAGKTLSAEFNNWADQADGSVLVRYGDSAVLATAVMGSQESNLDYFPLSVEYEERFYATGAILGSRFQRREGRPSDEAVLSGRIVDRTIRPLFPKGLKRDVQVILTVLSLGEYDTDVLSVIAASLALSSSRIPFNGPVSAIRVGQVAGNSDFIVNPTYTERNEDGTPKALLDVTACGKDGLINMIEVGADEATEETLVSALTKASEEIEKIQVWQKHIVSECGVEKFAFTPSHDMGSLSGIKETFVEVVLGETTKKNDLLDKQDFGILKKLWLEKATGKFPDVDTKQLDAYFEHAMDEYVHTLAIEKGKRVDGRAFDEVRPLFAQAGGVSPMLHGSGIFYRGATHVLGVVTLGGPDQALLVDTIEQQNYKKRFMLHYNFPPFSVGETGRVGGANRRMIGHGALAEKSLRAVIPAKNDFPYTIRIVSECLASNGSTSMATVCAGTLALMDAGVPIKKPVAGIAMGMMSDATKGAYKVLTDIQGPEDHHGDMDFKVAGTRDGVNGVQMDVKVEGVPLAILAEAFTQAKKARLEILDVIKGAIALPRDAINPRAPKIITMQVAVEQIGLVIGPGGKTINGIREKTGVEEISIEDDGTIFITGKNGSAELAHKEIHDLTREYEVGERFDGEVTRLMDFGAFVKIGPNTEGLVHISEMAPFRVQKVTDLVNVGDIVPVILKEIDEKGRYNLSIKAADADFASRKGLQPTTEHHARREDPKREPHT